MSLRILMLAILGLSNTIYAQNKIEGIVQNGENQETVYGARIVEIGTENKTISDVEGKFSLETSKDSVQIEISATGFRTETFTAISGDFFITSLTRVSQNIEEIVVTALSVKRPTKDLGYSVQTVSGEDVSQVKSVNVLDNLAGKVWLNSGALGMPANDGTPRVWFTTIKKKENDFEIQFHALDYDYLLQQTKMVELNLPKVYANTLQTGLWDSTEVLRSEEVALTGKRIDLKGKIFKV